MFEYEKEKQIFLKELNEGKFKIERIPNTADDYSAQKEERDVKAFENYLNSPLYQSFNDEAAK
jgi:hypothetical protein